MKHLNIMTTEDGSGAFKEYYIDCPIDSEPLIVSPRYENVHLEPKIHTLRIPRALANYILSLQDEIARLS